MHSFNMYEFVRFLPIFLVTLLGGGLWFFYSSSKDLNKKGKGKGKGRVLPPGPRGFPVIGSMHLIGPMPHLTFTDMSRAYGPLMYLRVGSVPTVIVSSPEMAQEFLRTHDAAFANRPPSEVFSCISYGLKGFAFVDSGPYWRDIRKLCVTNLLSPTKIASLRSVREEEVSLFVDSLMSEAAADRAVNLSTALGSVTADIACRMVMGRRCMNDVDGKGRRFQEVTDELMTLLGSVNVNDFIPFLGFFDFQRTRKRTMVVHRAIDTFLEKIIDEHNSEDDFLGVMLSLMHKSKDEIGVHFDRDTVKAILLDMLEASMDPIRTQVEWALSELLRNPQAMRKVQDELATVVGLHRQVEESDLGKLKYLGMVVKETMRLHPLSAFLFHHGKEETAVAGFRIPKGSTVLVNVWAISRDPKVWPDDDQYGGGADQFMPERFEKNDIDFRGQDFRLLPFGSGRRICAGMQLAVVVVPLMLGQLVHCFDWELPKGITPSGLDMTPTFGFTMPRANHLWAIPTKRLRSIDRHI